MTSAPRAATAVAVTSLVKRYHESSRNAVDGVSFTVAAGEVYGLLGPNGAGKTTTIGVLTTRIRADSGSARLYGVEVSDDPVGARRVLAVVTQHNNLDRSLTVRENLEFHAAYHGVGRRHRRARAMQLLTRLELLECAGSPVERLSGGQAQRVKIARSLMHTPRVVFLDEPGTGLDTHGRRFVRELVRELAADGVAVVLTTHDMTEAAATTDRVGIIDRGVLLAEDRPAGLVRRFAAPGEVEVGASCADRRAAEDLVRSLRGIPGVCDVRVTPGDGGPGDPGQVDAALLLRGAPGAMPAVDTTAVLDAVVTTVGAAGARLRRLGPRHPDLEDVVARLTTADGMRGAHR
ncbi:MAG: ABC transporter ATP-binding protein [Kineosporiaceae bacterium]